MVQIPENTVIQGLMNWSYIAPGPTDADGTVSWGLNPRTSFLLAKEEPRYQSSLKRAHELKAQYPLSGLSPENPKDLREIVEKEQAIVTELMKKVHEHYGYYNPHIASGADSLTHPSMNNDVARAHTDNPASLKEFEKDELICRHYAPLLNALCTEAGMKVARLEAIYMRNYAVKDGQVQPTKNGINTNLHSCVISLASGNIIEPTVSEAGMAYQKRIGEISVEDILAGKTLIVGNNHQLDAYGPGHAPAIGEDLIAARKNHLSANQTENLPIYVPQENKFWEKHASCVDDEFKKLTQECYDSDVKPLAERFVKAAQTGNEQEMQACCDSLAFTKPTLSRALLTSINLQDWGATKWLIDQGATQGLHDSVDRPSLPLWAPGDKLDQEYIRNLSEKLRIEPAAYLIRSIESGQSAHAEMALSLLKEKPKTPAVKSTLLWAADFARKKNYQRIAGSVENFIKQEYENVPTPGAFETALGKLGKGSWMGAAAGALLGIITAYFSGGGAIAGLLFAGVVALAGGAAGFAYDAHGIKKEKSSQANLFTPGPAENKTPSIQSNAPGDLEKARRAALDPSVHPVSEAQGGEAIVVPRTPAAATFPKASLQRN